MPPSENGDRFPMLCPTCAGVAGMPCVGGTTIRQNQAIDVGMRCTDCHHEWRVELPVIAPVLLPKPDRRRLAKALVRLSARRDSKLA